MKVNSIQQQNFRGLGEKFVNKLVDNPKTVAAIAGLAGCSVVGQKLVMSAGEATVGPMVDVGVGKAITAITNEKDGRTNQSSRVQAARTVSQTVGGTITGITIRLACIGAMTAACIAGGKKAGSAITNILTESGKINPENVYEYTEKMQKWGKALGGALATCVMMVTNFVLDVPIINYINKKITPLFGIKTENGTKAKEAK